VRIRDLPLTPERLLTLIRAQARLQRQASDESRHGQQHRRTAVLRADGRTGPVMAFVHPNRWTSRAGFFQMAQMSTWLPLHRHRRAGLRALRPSAARASANERRRQGCWEAIDEIAPGENAILVGLLGRLGDHQLHAQPPPSKTPALICQAPDTIRARTSPTSRIADYKKYGIDFRWRYHLRRHEPGVPPHAARDLLRRHVLRAQLSSATSTRSSISSRPTAATNPEDHGGEIACPSIILTGSEDATHPRGLPTSGSDQELRIEGAAGGWTRLPDRATRLFKPPHESSS
jgi:hypothetical protein